MTFVETSTVELKRVFTPSLKKEIVAFANSEGGTIYIGVEDDGNVIGVEDAQRIADSVNTMIHEAIAPDLSLFAEAHVERFEDVDLVVVSVHRGPDRPYCIAGKGLRPEGVYVRLGTSAQPVSFRDIRRMLREMSGDTFENTRSLEQGLSFSQAEKVFNRRGIDLGEAQKITCGLVEPDGFFSNLGLLLSDQCPSMIKLARFAGKDKSVFQTRREFEGSLLVQTESALEMLDLLNNIHAEVGARPERYEMSDYPAEALREVVLNAIAHRDYAIASYVNINIFDDRCEVLSPGSLPSGATWEGALAGVSVTRNTQLAALLYRLKWIEAYGTGISKVYESYRDSGFEPIFEFLDGAVKVVLPNRNAMRELPSADKAPRALQLEPEMVCSDDRQKVLEALSSNEFMGKQVVAQRCGFTPSKAARLLKELAANGDVESIGRTKGRAYRRLR